MMSKMSMGTRKPASSTRDRDKASYVREGHAAAGAKPLAGHGNRTDRPAGRPGLFGKTRERVLARLFDRPERAFTLRGLVRETGTGMGAVQRELANLVETGLVLREGTGRSVAYRANERSPIFKEVRALLLKVSGAAALLREALEPLESAIGVAFLFGSAARGALVADSDLDLLVIGEASFRDVVRAVSEAQEILGREVNPAVYGPDEWGRRVAEGHGFAADVMRGPKIFLLGTENDLERLAEGRVADGASAQRRRDGAASGPGRA
jgi:predicted nucleotidyltransferase